MLRPRFFVPTPLWDTSNKMEKNGLCYILDIENYQAQVTSMPDIKYKGNIRIPYSIYDIPIPNITLS
jgi:hypothetical protein